MSPRHPIALALLASLTLSIPRAFDAAAAAKPAKNEATKPAADDAQWKVDASHGPTHTISFQTDEATWLALDVSPDGSTIVFSLDGDLYTLPAAGGEATRITSGPAYDVQRRFSPDGSEIAFATDRGGTENLWVCDRTGAHARAVSTEKETRTTAVTAIASPTTTALLPVSRRRR